MGEYTDASGTTDNRTYSLFVCDRDEGVVTDVNAMGEILWEKGLYRGQRSGQGVGLRTISAEAMYDAVSEVIKSGAALGTLYSIKES